MMRWVVLSGAAALLGTMAAAGCGGPAQKCQDDTNCPAASRCEPESHVCIERREDTSCSPACQGWEFCSEMQCYPRYSALTVLEPAAGTVDGGATVRAQLQPIAAWIALNPPAMLAYRVNDGTTLSNFGDLLPVSDAGVYTGNISVAAGSYTLTTSFPGFPTGAPVSAPVAITVETTAPTFTVDAGAKIFGGGPASEQDPLQPNSYKRNDLVTVTITSTDPDLDENSVALKLQGIPTTAETLFPVTRGSCGPIKCFTATVDLATVQMLAFRGQMSLVAMGRDAVGNLGTRTVQIPVTRFKWSRTMPSSAAISASPAIGAQGTIYVATNAGGASTLSALKPDGTDQWAPVNLGNRFLASPAVGKGDGGEEVVYAIPSSNPPLLYALLGSDGGQAAPPATPSTTGVATASPLIALTRASGSDIRESATTFVNGSPDYALVTLRFGSFGPAIQPGDGGSVLYPSNVVGEDNKAFVGDNTKSIHEYAFAGNWGISSPDRVTLGTTIGLALTPTFIAGSTSSSVFAFPRMAGAAFSRVENSPSIPSFIGSDMVYSEGASLNAVRVNPSTGVSTTGTLGVATTTPLVGAGTYFVGTDNSVHLLDSTLSTLWTGTTENSTVVASSPNIDCARSSSGAKIPGPGTLYYGADNGKLYAIIVDNPGIDTTSPWPKYQHDPRNTGSLSTPLSDFTCP